MHSPAPDSQPSRFTRLKPRPHVVLHGLHTPLLFQKLLLQTQLTHPAVVHDALAGRSPPAHGEHTRSLLTVHPCVSLNPFSHVLHVTHMAFIVAVHGWRNVTPAAQKRREHGKHLSTTEYESALHLTAQDRGFPSVPFEINTALSAMSHCMHSRHTLFPGGKLG
jgi:hypothetical protein